jgi:anaphase-promoting complex subunit 10
MDLNELSSLFSNNSNISPFKKSSNIKPQSDHSRREIGDEGIWSLSSCKIGNGIEQLRDENLSTFWQSDDMQPHFILIEFPKKIRLNEIWIYLDYKTDESYTPSKISIKVENTFNEMVEVKVVDFEEPVGWFQIKLENKNSEGVVLKPYIKTMTVQIVILQNTHNGRDTHIRNVKLFAPREHKSFDMTFPNFESKEYTQFQTLR